MNSHDIVTNNLSRFGMRELNMAARLLAAYCEQSPDFLGEHVQVMMNAMSGYVFLTDEDYAVAMMNGDELEQFHLCPECGNEGFAEELREGCECCVSYLRDVGVVQ